MSDIDEPFMNSMLRKIRANTATLAACPRHLFDTVGYRMGQRVTCRNCGGEMRGTDVGWYIEGYEAGGGHVDDIWPGWRDKRPQTGDLDAGAPNATDHSKRGFDPK